VLSKHISFLVKENSTPLVASFNLFGAVGFISTRVKMGKTNLNEPLPALATFDTAVFDKPLNFADAAKTVDGVSKPAPTAVATAEPAIALFKNNLLSILTLLVYSE
jgi:hypothetical protein